MLLKDNVSIFYLCQVKTKPNNLLKTKMSISFHPKCSRNGRHPLTLSLRTALGSPTLLSQPHTSLSGHSETFVGYQAWLQPLMAPEKHWKDKDSLSLSLSAFKLKKKYYESLKKNLTKFWFFPMTLVIIYIYLNVLKSLKNAGLAKSMCLILINWVFYHLAVQEWKMEQVISNLPSPPKQG